MRVSEVYPRPWLRVSDLEPGKAYRAVVERVEMRSVMGRPRLVIAVRGRDGVREIFLNRVSAWGLADAWGDDCGKWPGREIVFRRARVAGKEAIIVTAANHTKEA